MTDALFEDGSERPLKLLAHGQEDLTVLSALLQDSVFKAGEMRWDAARRRFAILVNRPRWETVGPDRAPSRDFERVQSVLSFCDVLKLRSLGIDKSDPEVVLSLLAVNFTPGEDGTGEMELIFAGDGAISLAVEAIDVVLEDVTKPYIAVSKQMPTHRL